MMNKGDYVGFRGRGYDKLRGIVLEGPRIAPGTIYTCQYRVKWLAGTNEHWKPRPTGSWEPDNNIILISSLETKCQ
jgi:hypothetical protein